MRTPARSTTAAAVLLLVPLLVPLLAPLLIWSAPADAARPTQGGGEGGDEGSGARHRHGDRGGQHPWVLFGMERAEVTLWRPDLEPLPVPFDGHWAHPPRSGIDNYHALVAIAENQAPAYPITRSVIRYDYRHGKPSGHSPAELLAREKAPLEIVPDPLPREHYRYVEGERWGFLLRHRGEPVTGAKLELRTFHDTLLTGVSDADGRVVFTLPTDFGEVRPGRRATPPAPFVVQAVLEREGRIYDTTLQAEYHPSPRRWHSSSLALWALGGGFLAGLGLTRIGRAERREEKA